MIDREYLEFVGFKKVSPSEVVLEQGRYNKVPTLSCKLGNSGGCGGGCGGDVVFVLSYYPDVDSYKFQKEFTFYELNDIINLIGDEEYELFHYFSLNEGFLNRVRSARFSGGGRKPWKKRNWPLPVKWSKVKCLFDLEHVVDSETVANCLMNMDICVRKAAESFSYQPFELYYSSFNELLRAEGKKGRGSRKIAWSQFKCAVEDLQRLSEDIGLSGHCEHLNEDFSLNEKCEMYEEDDYE